MLQEVLSFALDGGLYCLPVASVEEVLDTSLTIHPLAGVPQVISGIARWRGHSIPVVDLRGLIGLTPQPNPRHGIVIKGRRPMLLLVDEVGEVLVPPESSVTSNAGGRKLAIPRDVVDSFIRMDDGCIPVLNPERLALKLERGAQNAV
jgi:chemotaxis signal transduction protein